MIRVFLAIYVLGTVVFQTGCSGLFYHPDPNIYVNPQKIKLNPEEIFFESKDGTKLHGWFFKAPNRPAKATLIQFHGNAENISSHFLSLVWAVQHGFNLFTFDYRGYGRSEGKPSQEGLYKDGLAALGKAWELHKQTKTPLFIAYGQSLGGTVMMRSLQDSPIKSNVDLMVLDSSFLSYQTIARRKLAASWLTWILSPLAYILVSDQYSAEDSIGSLNMRTLIIHDEKDPVVPFKSGEEIYEKAQGPKEFVRLQEGRHVGVFFEAGRRERFVKYLSEFPKLPFAP